MVRRLLGGMALVIAACSVELAPADKTEPGTTGGDGGIGGELGGSAGSVTTGGVAGIPSTGGSAGSIPLGGNAGSDAALGGSGGSGGSAPDASVQPGPLIGNFAISYYWVTTEEEFTGVKNTNLYDTGCKILATVSATFAASLASIGTGRLSDGRVLNYAGSCSCPTSPCYLEADAQHPWGYGVSNAALVPFRTLAVQKAEIPYGTALYVPTLVGVTMPGAPPWGGFVHDGCLSADDTGSSIQALHADWFVALKTHYAMLDATLDLAPTAVYDGGSLCP